MLKSNFAGLGTPSRGEVRDIYDLGGQLLFVATDRLSAFDVVLPAGIPDKGQVLTLLSALWCRKLRYIIANHLITTDVAEYPDICLPYADQLLGRSMLVKKATPLCVECVVRGYLYGSSLKEYRQTQSICGISLPAGLVEAQELPEPLFTPTTKAETGHDQNLTFEQVVELFGRDIAVIIGNTSLRLYQRAQELAKRAGIIIADTKFEFGLLAGQVILIDEALTPDSSRFWPADRYKPGRSQPSFDKQFVRDWLEAQSWNKQPPAPALPDEVVRATTEKYEEALSRLTPVLI